MSVYDDQKVKTDQQKELEELERSFAAPAATESGSDVAKRNTETQELEDAYNAPTATESGSDKLSGKDSKPDSAAKLREKEESVDDQVGGGYTGDGKSKKRRGWMTKKRASIIGSIFGITTIAGIVLTPLSGPLEFMQFANAIKIPHFSNNEIFSDGRLSKVIVYSRTKSVGDTRLSALTGERQFKNKMLADMEKIGLKPVTDSRIPGASNLDHLKYWQFDTTNEKSPLYGKSPDEIRAWASEKLSVKESDVRILGNQRNVYISADGLVKGAKTSYLINREMGHGGISSAIRGRILGKFFNIGFHPLRPLDEKINAKGAAYWKSFKEAMDKRRAEYIKNGVKPVVIDTSKASQSDTRDGKGTAIEGGGTTEVTPESKNSLKAFFESPGGKLTGGALLGAGMVCAANAVAVHVGDFKDEQVIQPAMRTGMEIISVSQQMLYDKVDVTNDQVNYYGDILVSRDADGNIKDSWSQAKSIVANQGGEGGIDLPPETKSAFIAGVPDWLKWAESDWVVTLCGPGGQIVQGIIGIATLATGGIATGIAALVASAVVFDQVISRTADWLSGQAFKMGTGAVLGGQADYGAFYASNSVAMQFGGMPISAKTSAQSSETMVSLQQDEFSQQALSTKLFSKTDTRSLVARLALSLNTGKQLGIGGLLGKLGNIPGQLASVGTLFVPKSFAQVTNSTYDYGTTALGWSEEDSQNADIENPLANADWVANLLNGPEGQKYIDKTRECFGVVIERGNQGWTAIPGDTDAFKAYYADGKSPCDMSGVDYNTFVRVRAFVADTAAAESYACLNGDETACSMSGFGG